MPRRKHFVPPVHAEEKAARQLARQMATLEETLLGAADLVADQTPTTGPMFAIWTLGRREASLYRGFRHLVSGPSAASAFVVLRALVELAITVPWIWLEPEVHLALWLAEADRQALRSSTALGNSVFADRLNADATAQHRADSEARIEEARTLIRNRAQQGRPVDGVGLKPDPYRSLLPPLSSRARQLARPEITEAYEIVHARYSDFVHSGPASFFQYEDTGDEPGLAIDGPFRSPFGAQAQAATVFAIAMGDVSRIMGLGVEGECEHVRMMLTGRELPHP